jgi:hypothetical protein
MVFLLFLFKCTGSVTLHVKKFEHNESDTMGKALLSITEVLFHYTCKVPDVHHRYLRTVGLQGMNRTQYTNTQTAEAQHV